MEAPSDAAAQNVQKTSAKGDRLIESSKSCLFPLSISLRIEESGTCRSRRTLNLYGQDQVVTLGESRVQVRTRFLVTFVQGFLCRSLLSPSSPTLPSRSHPLPRVDPNALPCVDSIRPRVYWQQVHML